MNPKKNDSSDSLEYFDRVVDQAWQNITTTYDVHAPCPSVEALFRNVNICSPSEAAEDVVTNMLLEVIENVDRFSSWYTKPACEFGLTSVWNCQEKCHQWILTMEAYIRWISVIHNIQSAIEKNKGVLQGIMLVDELMNEEKEERCVVAHCGCEPPRFIKVKVSMLEKANIICDACLQPFVY